MRGAWGKPYGTVARVNIGQVILSIRCKDANAPVVMEALRRARYKFPGRQKIIISKKWGFTSVAKGDYMKLKEDKMVIQYVTTFIGEVPVLNEMYCTGTERTCSLSARRARWSRTFAPNSALDCMFSLRLRIYTCVRYELAQMGRDR